ncbi:YncE family protein [Streptomyces thioluteus]|uniref:YncE family protein n=1 Tax=Streptomyces thioluteus TaxID=66431 RepID=UPI0031EA94F5
MTLEKAQRDGSLRVTAAFLQLDLAADLFARFLPDAALVVDDVTVDPAALRVTGRVSLLGASAPGAAVVLFLPTPDGRNIAGVRVDAALPADGPGLPPELADIPAVLEPVGVGTRHLVFGVEPYLGGADPTAEVGCGLELTFPGGQAASLPYIWGYLPRGRFQGWSLSGRFPGVRLSGSDALRRWAKLPSGAFELPGDIAPEGTTLELTGISLDFVPSTSEDGTARWRSLGIRLALTGSWQALGNLLTLDDLHAEFAVVDPLGAAPAPSAVVGGRITLADGVAVDVSVSLPDRTLSGVLEGPLPLGTLLAARFPDVPVPHGLTVDRLSVGAELGRGPAWGYGIDLDLKDVWHVTDDIALSEVTLTLLHAGGTTTAEATATWQLGAATVDIHGTWQTGAGWQFEMDASGVGLGDAFAAFGIQAPPVLQGVTVEQLTVTYDSEAKKFGLHARADFPLGADAAVLDVTVGLTRRTDGQPGYDQQYEGSLTLEIAEGHELTFTVKDVQQAEFTAGCTDSKGVSFADLARLLGVTDPSAEQVLSVLGTLDEITVAYASARRSIVLAAKEKGGGSLVVVSDKPSGGDRAWAVRVGLGLAARLSQVPLLQGQIPDVEDVGLCGLGALAASGKLDAARVAELNKALTAADAELPRLPADGLAKGMAFTVDLKLPGRTGTTSLAVRGAGGGGKALAAQGGNGGSGLPLVAWIGVQRSVGPLTLRRVGVGFADGTVWVLFDASLGMAGLTLGVDGLGLGVELSHPTVPKFRLDGLSVGYSRPPLAIDGALVIKKDDHYDPLVEGVLAVKAEEFGLTALGAYARPTAHPDQPSFFVFGKVNGEFGGPPPVQITGISAGFGFNTDLRLPDGDQVLDFPFLQDLTTADPLQVLNTLMDGQDPWVRPATGQMWFAAGLAFRIFEFLDGQALLALEVGDDFAVAVLGTAEARFPKEQSLGTYARVRLGLSAKYRASEGALKITAQIAPGSFVLDENCVLTGGFALYTWFDGANAGDFALTLGGYHPKYPVPKHYPQVPRLGFTWPVTSELTISGGSYFALTPGAIMAGGALDVNYRSGDLHAWLTAYADLLIEWAPFHFDADIGIGIGVSYVLDLGLFRETISVEVGASLRLWGPPTAGEVTIHLWFISFTIGFGDGSARDDTAAPWADVVKQLPAKEDAVRLVAMDGLVPAKAGDALWVVTPGAFSFAVRTAVPVSEVKLTKKGTDAQEIAGRKVDIRPRRDEGKDLDSVLTVTLAKDGEVHDLGAWYTGDAAQDRASLPAALWGAYDGKLTVGSAQRVDDQLMGVDLRLPPPAQGGTPGPVKAGAIAFDERRPDGILPLRKPAAVARPVAPELVAEEAPVRRNVGAITGDMTGTLVDQSRDRLFAAMDYLGVSPGTNEALTATDALVAGDVDAKPAEPPVPGTPTASERLYVLGAGRTVTPVDAQSLTVYAPSVLGTQGDPAGLAVGPDGKRLVAVDTQQGVDILDISANPPGPAPSLLPQRIWMDLGPRALSVSPDSRWAYAAFAQPNQVQILDLSTNPPTKHRDYPVEAVPGDVVPAARWDAQSQVLYLARTDKGVVTPIDVTGDKWPVELGDLPAGPSPTRLAVDPEGRWLYALNEGRSTVTVVDVAARKIVTTLRTGTGPSALAASPDGSRLYAANATAGTVSVFDTTGTLPQETGDPVWVGPEPIALAVSTASDRLYVLRAKTRAVQVVDVAGAAPVLLDVTVPLADDPVALAVTAPPPAVKNTRTTEGGAA